MSLDPASVLVFVVMCVVVQNIIVIIELGGLRADVTKLRERPWCSHSPPCRTDSDTPPAPDD